MSSAQAFTLRLTHGIYIAQTTEMQKKHKPSVGFCSYSVSINTQHSEHEMLCPCADQGFPVSSWCAQTQINHFTKVKFNLTQM